MEEISFKPITKGLGFHKNKLKIDEEALRDIQWKKDLELPEIDFAEDNEKESHSFDSNSDWFDDSSLGQTVTSYRKPKVDLLSDDVNVVERVKRELEQKALLSKTLPRKDIAGVEAKRSSEVQSLRKSEAEPELRTNLEGIRDLEKRVEESKVSAVVGTSYEPELQKTSGNWFASLIDLVVVFGMVNLFMSSLLFVTDLDVFQIISKTYQDPMTQLSLGLIFLVSCFLYTVVSRSFFSSTLGDWALDIELGTKEQQASVYYPVKVSFRFFMTSLTGFVLLPFLSVLVGRDLAGLLTGMQLFKLKD